MGKGRHPRGRNWQIERVLQIVRDLDRVGGMTLYDLADTHKTNVRTIRRDLAALEGAGLPLKEEPGDGRAKRWRIAYSDKLRNLSSLLDSSHYLALRVAMEEGGATRGSPNLFAALEDLSDKIEKAIGPRGRAKLKAISSVFYPWQKFGYRQTAPEYVWRLVQAVSEKRICRITYKAAGPTATERIFVGLPLKLFVHDGALYVHLQPEKWGDPMMLNVQRMRKLEVTDERGVVRPGYDPDKLAKAAFGVFGGTQRRFKLRFTKNIAEYIRERTWHPTQRLRNLKDGGLELTFTCGDSPDLRGWIAGWRKDVVVVEPAEVRTELREVGMWMAERYK